MSISIGSDPFYSASGSQSTNSAKTLSLKNTLNNINNSSSASDEELMDACKSFESYLLEQVFKGMEKTIMKNEDEEESDYLSQFGDMLYEEVAKDTAESQGLGIAQILYESMKRNS